MSSIFTSPVLALRWSHQLPGAGCGREAAVTLGGGVSWATRTCCGVTRKYAQLAASKGTRSKLQIHYAPPSPAERSHAAYVRTERIIWGQYIVFLPIHNGRDIAGGHGAFGKTGRTRTPPPRHPARQPPPGNLFWRRRLPELPIAPHRVVPKGGAVEKSAARQPKTIYCPQIPDTNPEEDTLSRCAQVTGVRSFSNARQDDPRNGGAQPSQLLS